MKKTYPPRRPFRVSKRLNVPGPSAPAPSGAEPLTVVLLGMPNVGKSALFNRLAGRRVAIVYDQPGVTRDCRALNVTLPNGRPICLIDTPGVPSTLMGLFGRRTGPTPKFVGREDLEAIMLQQTLEATKEADVILFLFDGKNAFAADALDFFRRTRTFGKPLIAAINKVDVLKGAQRSDQAAYTLGIEPLLISAEHGHGMTQLIDALEAELMSFERAPKMMSTEEVRSDPESIHPNEDRENFEPEVSPVREDPNLNGVESELKADRVNEDKPSDRVINLAIIGRPNVGKSTLINALLKRPAQIVADVPGVTRDAVDFDWIDHGRRFRLTDTAGIRRRSKVRDELEKISVGQALNALNFAHVVVLVMDAEELETTDYGEMLQQDLLLAVRALDEGRCVVLALNKWDRVHDKGRLKRAFAESLTFASDLKDVPVVLMSAAQGLGLGDLLRHVREVEEAWNRRIPTARLNAWLRETVQRHPPKGSSWRAPKLKYMAQVNTRPPQFVIFGTRTEDLAENYRRFLMNQLKQAFGLAGLPVRVQIRQQANPYQDKKRR